MVLGCHWCQLQIKCHIATQITMKIYVSVHIYAREWRRVPGQDTISATGSVLAWKVPTRLMPCNFFYMQYCILRSNTGFSQQSQATIHALSSGGIGAVKYGVLLVVWIIGMIHTPHACTSQWRWSNNSNFAWCFEPHKNSTFNWHVRLRWQPHYDPSDRKFMTSLLQTTHQEYHKQQYL